MSFTIPTTALSRLTRRARWVVRGIETDIVVRSIGTYWQLYLPGSAGWRVFTKRPLRDDRFFIPSDAWRRLVTIQPETAEPWRSALGPTLTPISASPDRVVIGGVRGKSVFSDTPMGGDKYYPPTSATLRIFNRYAVVDPDIPGPRRPIVQFMGVGRYGFPKYHAWIRVALRGTRPAFAAGDGLTRAHRRFWIPHDPKPVQRVREAISAAMRMADRVLLEIGPTQRRVGRGVPILVERDKFFIGRPN